MFMGFLSIFQHYCSCNAVMKPVRLYLLKEKRKTANGKRKPETEGINITCAGTEPNQNSMPGHARRGCCPVPGEGMQLGALGLLRHRAEKWKGSTRICLLLTTGKHQHFWKVALVSLSGVLFQPRLCFCSCSLHIPGCVTLLNLQHYPFILHLFLSNCLVLLWCNCTSEINEVSHHLLSS